MSADRNKLWEYIKKRRVDTTAFVLRYDVSVKAVYPIAIVFHFGIVTVLHCLPVYH